MPNKIQQNPGTTLKWADSGADYALTFKGLATNTGRQGATHDFGASGARSMRFGWRCMVHFDTATPPVVGETIRIYLKTSDGTVWDNDMGEGDISYATADEDKLSNLHLIGVIVVDEAAADVPMSASGEIVISAREVAPVIWNGTADTLDDDASPTNSEFSLIPMDVEIQ